MRLQSSRRPKRPAALRVALLSALVAASLGSRAPVASADTFRWIGDVPPLPTSWANGLNWLPIGGPSGLVSTDVIEFRDTFGASINDRRSAFLLNGLRAFVAAPAGATGSVGGFSLMFSGSSPFIEVGSAGNLRVDNALTGSATVTKSGSGVLVLGGNNAGFSGTLSIADGQVTVAGSNSLGTLTRADVGASGRLHISTAQTFGGLSGTGIVELAAAVTVGIDPAGSTFEGQLSGSGALTKSGVSTFRLGGTGVGYTGAVTVASGILALNGISPTGNASGVTIDAPGTLRIDTNQSLRRIAGTGALVLDANLTVGQGGDSTFDGSIDGPGGLIKVGAGSLNLGGNHGGYSGPVTVSAGTLALTGPAPLSGAEMSSLTIESAGKVHIAAAGRRIGALSGGGALVLDQDVVIGAGNAPSTFVGTISGAGNLTKSGTGTFTFGGTATFTGQTYASRGVILVSGGVLEGGSGLSVAGGQIDISGPDSRWSSSGVLLVGGRTGSAETAPDVLVEYGASLLVAGAIVGAPTAETAAHIVVRGRVPDESGARATLSVDGTLNLGNSSRGVVLVSEGGLLKTASAVLGARQRTDGGGVGTVKIDGFAGPASWDNAGLVVVGDTGFGSVNVERGGSVTTGSMKVGNRKYLVQIGPTGSFERSQGQVEIGGLAGETLTRATVSVLGQLDVGLEGTGRVDIYSGGTLDSLGAAIGAGYDGLGFVNVGGYVAEHAAVWNNTGELRVGQFDRGELNIEQNALVTTGTAFVGSGGFGIARVSGNGARWIVDGAFGIGSRGAGELTVASGGLVKSGPASIGSGNGALGTAVVGGLDAVDGPATWEVDGDMIVGSEINVPGYLRSSLTLLADGQTLVSGAVRVRDGGVIVLDGGLLQADSLEVSTAAGFDWRTGTVRVKSAKLGASGWSPFAMVLTSGQVLEADDLDVGAGVLAVVGGQAHAGALHMAGGTVAGTTWTPPTTLSGYGTIATRYASSAEDARIHAHGGSLVVGDLNSQDAFRFGGEIRVGAGSRLVVSSGSRAALGSLAVLEAGSSLVSINGLSLGIGSELRATGSASIVGAFTNQGAVKGPVAPGAVLVFDDDVDGAGSFTGNVRFEQIHSPGNSPAIVSFENVAYASTSTLHIEILGPDAGTGHDRIEASGLAALAGTLDVAFLQGYAPTIGTSFIVMTFGSRVGQFGAMEVAGLSPTVRLVADYGAHDLTLTVAAVPEPHEWALMMAGLGVVGWTVRRKRVG